MPAQVAVVANTGAGPDIVCGFGPDPQVYADKVVDVTDVADYLGKKYGGWYRASVLFGQKWKSNQWVALPMGGTTGPCNYRISWVKEAGFEKIPNDLDQFLTLCRNLKKNGHPCGFALSHAPGDAPAYANWLLWAHGGKLVDEDGQVTLDTKETRAALDYAKAMQETMIPGTMSWNGASNNQSFAAGLDRADAERRVHLLRGQEQSRPAGHRGRHGPCRRCRAAPPRPRRSSAWS